MLIALVLLLMLAFLLVEKQQHQRRLTRIPMRIHVNGTRGKTSLVTQLAASLRQQGIRCMAKTTGDHPVWILPDGQSRAILRRGPARLQEQITLVRYGAKKHVHVLIVECMALHAELQQVSEQLMIQATHTIITNIRHDHQEMMGETLDDIAGCLALSLPSKEAMTLYTTPQDAHRMSHWDHDAKQRNTVVIARDEQQLEPHTTLMLSIQKIHSLLGLPPCQIPIIMPLPVAKRITIPPLQITFLDLFSVNDPDSFLLLFNPQQVQLPRPWLAVFNTRADRPLRSVAFIQQVLQKITFDAIAITGDHAPWVVRALRQSPVWAASHESPMFLLKEAAQRLKNPTFSLIGMANFHGAGHTMRMFFKQG